MPFVELDPEIALKAIEGYENALDPDLKTMDAFYRQFSCPRCHGEVRKEFSTAGEHGGHAFSDKSLMVARALLRCISCECLFDPHSGMLIERGRPPKKIVTLGQ